jgi:hypothetical protein
MNNLEKLFNALDAVLRSGQKLKELGPILTGYDGEDWKQYEK